MVFVVHWTNYGPKVSGMYESVKNQVVYERRAGLRSEMAISYEKEPTPEKNAITWEEAKKADVWVLHSNIPSELADMKKKKVCVAVLHGPTEHMMFKEWEKVSSSLNLHINLLWEMDATVCINTHEYDIMRLYDEKVGRCRYIPNSIDLEEMKLDAVWQYDHHPAIISCDTPRVEKLPLHIIWAMPYIVEKIPDAKLNVFSLLLEPIGMWRNVFCRSHKRALETHCENIQLANNNLKPFQAGADVGFNNNYCLQGDTLIPLLDGTSVPIKDLVDKPSFFVYSQDLEKKKVVVGVGRNCRKINENVPILKVTLDNGSEIRCDHREGFMMRDGSYKHAKDLNAGDSLMPLIKGLNKSGYETVTHPDGAEEVTYRLSDRYNLEQGLYGDIEHKPVPHHKNFHKTNNSPDNLQRLSGREHIMLHSGRNHELAVKGEHPSQIASREGTHYWQTPEYANIISKRNKEKSSRGECPFQREDVRKKTSERLKIEMHKKGLLGEHPSQQSSFKIKTGGRVAKLWAEGTHPFQNDEVQEHRKSKQKESIKKLTDAGIFHSQIAAQNGSHHWSSKTEEHTQKDRDRCLTWNQTTIPLKGKVRAILNKISDVGLKVTEANYGKIKKEYFYKTHPTYQTAIMLGLINHKVVSVESAGTADVYDFEVENYYNFALDCGVFVHNSGIASRVTMEMMAYGVPVVSYNGEYTKYHAKPFDVHSIAEQMALCWADLTAPGSTLKEDTKKYAQENFHREKYIPQYVELYKELLEKK